MRSKCTHLLMLTAWLLATGSHWDVVQVFAWGRMFAQNVRVLPALDAAELTFSPTRLCKLCQVVRDAKQDRPGESAPAGKILTKEPVVFLARTQVVIAAPTSSPWIVTEVAPMACDRTPPPTPPPRAVAAA
jgi:hypothetical protein